MANLIDKFTGNEIETGKKQPLEYSAGDANTEIPVDVNFDADLHSVFQEPLPNAMPEKSQEVPGFFETVVGKFTEQEEFIQLAKYTNRKIADNSPLDDYVDPNWSAFDDKTALIGVDPRNAGYILDATGPKDQRRRYNYVLDQQEHNERINRGSIIGQLLGGGTGFALSPSSLLPIAKAVKYAKVSQTFLQTLPKMAAGIALGSASHEAVLQTTKIGGNLHDWVIDSMIDTVLGTAFMGVHLGYSGLSDAYKLTNAKGILQMMNKGVSATPVIDEKGIVQGYKATAVDNSVGAAEVDMAQVYLDAALSKNPIYGIPYIGETVGKALGSSSAFVAGIISPKIRMLNSPFSSIRGFANAFVEHAFETLGIEKGRSNETPFETMMSLIRGSNVTLKTQYDGLFLKRNGIEYDSKKFLSRTKANVIGMKEQVLKTGDTTRNEFGREVQNVLITEEPSNVSAVNEAAKLLREGMDPLYLEYLKLHGISDKILVPRTTKGFLSRVYWAARMELEEDRWMREVPEKLAADDAEIINLLQPVNNAERNIRQATQQHETLIRSNASTEEIKLSSDNLEDLKRAKSALENDLQDQLRDNPDYHRHIDDINAVSYSEAEQIKGILKPLNKLEIELNDQKEIVRQTKDELARNKSAALKAKTKETAEKRSKLKDMGENDVRIAEDKLREVQERYDLESERLQEQMHNKQIPEELYFRIPDSNRYKLKDHTNRLKLRDVYESDFARQVAAKAYYDSILNQTAEDNISAILSKSLGQERENPTVQRTLMIDDKWLYDNNWLHPDPSINVMNYRSFVGRQNSIKKILNRLTVNGTFDELIKRFASEHTNMKNDLIKPIHAIEEEIAILKAKANPSDADKGKISSLEKQYPKLRNKYEKAVKRLGRKYKRGKEDLELSIAMMRNKSKYSAKAREFSRMANLYAVATKLGFLPFTMTTDLMANVFKHGFWPTIKDGLFPMLKTLGASLNTKEGEAIRENAAHAYMAQHHINMAMTDKNWTGTSQTYEPVQGKLATGLETLAHYSGNFSLANYVENGNEMLTAMIIQAKIMKAMKAHLDGNLSQKDLKDLLKYDLDPKIYAERFMEGWKAAGSDGALGSMMSRYWEWGDKEASNQMSQGIHRAVKDTIVRKGYLDAPFAMNNPLINSIFLFKGYVLASMTRFLGPLMQKPDIQKLLGTMLMMTVGATQNPLRRLVAGQDPMQEEDHMFQNAVRDGGVFSILGDTYQEMNFLTNGFLQETVTNERYRGRTEMGVFNGPIGSMANDMTRVIGALASGQMNKTDLKRIAVNLPFVYSWELRSSVNKWIESRKLPKTRAAARRAQQR